MVWAAGENAPYHMDIATDQLDVNLCGTTSIIRHYTSPIEDKHLEWPFKKTLM